MVELTVLDENGDRAPNVLGKVAIPLLTVSFFKFIWCPIIDATVTNYKCI